MEQNRINNNKDNRLDLQARFNVIAEALGSRFAAVNYVSSLARKLCLDTNNEVLQSQAITWAITGEKPAYTTHKISIDKLNQEYQYSLDEVLCYVDNEEVCDSVRLSYNKSLEAHHLIYLYSDGLSEYDKPRVRILLRIIWYNLQLDLKLRQ